MARFNTITESLVTDSTDLRIALGWRLHN